ncbi:MAG: 4Fe-4S binding protein [Coriobacteriales bacterium]|nr:4Fe-4S binding protein [Coriobacteriales bacterium]
MSKRTLLVCCGTGCLASGAAAVADALDREIAASGVDAFVERHTKRTGCNGFCENGPIVRILPDDIAYYKVKSKDAQALVQSIGSEPVLRLLYKDDRGERVLKLEDNPFYRTQKRFALQHIGRIDPLSLDDYLAVGGYSALKKALTLKPEEIIEEVKASGLRGRGGAGFPTGIKWSLARSYDEFPKYVVCNGDEGDPGAFMDRSLLEGDPHSIIEGLAICALAIGAEQGFFYIRDEYHLALTNVNAALEAARVHGFIGDRVCGTPHALHLEVVRGGGAFVCGESTALMQSIEGKIGEPRAKYIRSVKRGLWDQPTVLNNVETLANIPSIILQGGKAFAASGTESSSGGKVFSLVGKVKRTGLVEVPMGVTLKQLVYDIGGGVKENRPFKAVQIGGPSGGCLPESKLDLPIDFDTLTKEGAMMGSGGLIVMDHHDCMVEVARYYTSFLAEESCGKCTPCREGLRHTLRVLTDITEGRGQEGDIELLEQLGETIKDSSLCALGGSAPNPVLSTIRYFRSEYEAHIRDHSCPAGVCAALTAFAIDTELCTRCGACLKSCSVAAISGSKNEPYRIDASACISCGSCRLACRFDAVLTSKLEAGGPGSVDCTGAASAASLGGGAS